MIHIWTIRSSISLCSSYINHEIHIWTCLSAVCKIYENILSCTTTDARNYPVLLGQSRNIWTDELLRLLLYFTFLALLIWTFSYMCVCAHARLKWKIVKVKKVRSGLHDHFYFHAHPLITFYKRIDLMISLVLIFN